MRENWVRDARSRPKMPGGGPLLLGIEDGAEIVSARADDRELQRIANLILVHLGITPSIRVIEMQGFRVVEVRVDPAPGLVPYRGRYLRRVGATNRDFSPDELARHILKRSRRSWDSLPSEWTLEEVDRAALEYFALVAALSERQIKAGLYVKEHGKTTSTKSQEITGVRKRWASNDLKNLQERGVLIKKGTTGKGTFYVLKGRERG